jgi:cell division protein FtsB
MTAFHFCFDLNHFGFIAQDFHHDPFWTWQRTAIVSLFLFTAGLSQAVAWHGGQGWLRFWKRWAQVAGCALLVSLGSAWMFPKSWIGFGVLHGMAVMLVLVALFVVYALTLKTAMLMESRRHNQELEAQRKLAETAEASRLSELRTQIEREFAQLRDAIGRVDGRMDSHEQAMKQSLNEAANGLAALVAEMDDKIDRALARHASDTKGDRDEHP